MTAQPMVYAICIHASCIINKDNTYTRMPMAHEGMGANIYRPP